jgi:hypothetical protein
MPVPGFSVGEVLTSSAMNAVALWRITGCTVSSTGGTAATASNGVIQVGTGNTSITVSNAFNSSFDNYRIVYGGGTGSTAITLSLQLGASTTGYYSVVNYASYAALGTPLSTGDNNQALWRYVGYADANYAQMSLDLIAPNLARWTTFNAASWAATTVAGTSSGIHQVATAYTAFTLGVNTGSLTGGRICVYGYND